MGRIYEATVAGFERKEHGVAVVMMVVAEENDVRYHSSNVTSGAVWPTIQDALLAGARACEQFNKDGVFPNMCERW